jgi:energy-coupling factor transporter ATP-binding protein EcfA2
MALEEQIVEWAKTRPAWQRLVLQRIATGHVLAEHEISRLVSDILKSVIGDEVTFGLEHLPHVAAEDPPVRLTSVAEPHHVNALESEQPLTFEPDGLTIVYGDNGSGKSGYARLLKRITRARHQEEILTDVFRDTAIEKPSANLSVKIGDNDLSLHWPESTSPDLQRMLFFDGACGNAYVSTESSFPYRPSALFVLDGLIEVCASVRTRIDEMLAENASRAVATPEVPDEIRNTGAGTYLAQLSEASSVESLDALIASFETSEQSVEDLKREEARLRGADPTKERRNLTRQAEKHDALHTHLVGLASVFSDDATGSLQKRLEEIKSLQGAANLLVKSFDAEPLPGIASSSWRALWEAARRYSEEQVHPERTFPVVDDGARCVLCQQTLGNEARDRLSRFERFIKDDVQVRLDAARSDYGSRIQTLTQQVVLPEAVAGYLGDLESMHAALVSEVRSLLDRFATAQKVINESLEGSTPLTPPGIVVAETLARLSEAAKLARETANTLSNPEAIQKLIASASARRQELELLERIKECREAIVAEIARRKERDALEAVKTAAATGPITKKVTELSEASITEVVRDAFTRETDRLRLERVTISRTRAEKGALLHLPKLVGARQDAKLPRVFSEGERTALGLAAFFTEARLNASQSALILDDPVSSLDHVRRGLVAARLAELAQGRQVVVFTHDVALVADLKREAAGCGVPIAERSIIRSRANERKPGTCAQKHPWKAKDVLARLNELRTDLARIKNESGSWDEKAYEDAVAVWAGNLSETWERIFSQEIVGPVLAEGGLEVRPMQVKVLARFMETDQQEFSASYSRVSQWAKRHDKSTKVNYVPPDIAAMGSEIQLVDAWFQRVKGYKN